MKYGLLSLKVVKFDTEMYLNFSNFQGRTWAGGGTSLGLKMGTSVGWGVLTKFLPDGGTPCPSQEKKTLLGEITMIRRSEVAQKNVCKRYALGPRY